MLNYKNDFILILPSFTNFIWIYFSLYYLKNLQNTETYFYYYSVSKDILSV